MKKGMKDIRNEEENKERKFIPKTVIISKKSSSVIVKLQTLKVKAHQADLHQIHSFRDGQTLTSGLV